MKSLICRKCFQVPYVEFLPGMMTKIYLPRTKYNKSYRFR